MDNKQLKQQLQSIIKALYTISVKGQDVLTLAQVLKGLEYTIEKVEGE